LNKTFNAVSQKSHLSEMLDVTLLSSEIVNYFQNLTSSEKLCFKVAMVRLLANL